MLSRTGPGRLYVVATPIGNLEDITLRAIRVLREAHLISAEDTRRTGRLLSHLGLDTPMSSLHAHNERDRIPAVLELLQGGRDVALVTDAGTPLLSDPGSALVRAVLDAGLRVEPIPGPSAVTTALVMAGEGSHGFVFLGFPPVKAGDRKAWFARAVSHEVPVVFFEAPHRVARTFDDLIGLVGGDRRGLFCREMTKLHEELVRGPLAELRAHPSVVDAQGEFTLILLPDDTTAAMADDEAVGLEFDRLTEKEGMRRREAVSLAARRVGMSTRDAYAALERRKIAMAGATGA